MNRLIDSSGRAISIREELGKGGEGAVYALPDPELCAKIYHKPLTPDRAEKVRVMAAMRTNALTSLTAWPVGLVSNENAEPVGIIIPRIKGAKDIHKLYSPKSRRSDFTRADWRFLIRAATNTARAFGAVHTCGCVIGDVNHGSVLVAQDATVRLIDCDSFQVQAGGRRFLCDVGVETYTPPELQGKSFNGVVRSENHDAFGLAVLIFHLLMMGRHPYSGRYSGAGDMPVGRAIEEHRFAYGARRAGVLMDRPPGAPSLDLLGPSVTTLFERAFSRQSVFGGRPVAREWVTDLSALEGELRQCSANQAHWYRRAESGCPWCKLEGTTGTILFPLVFQSTTPQTALDLDALLRQTAALGQPGSTSNIVTPIAHASAGALKLRKHNRIRGFTSAIAAVAAFVGLLAAGFPAAAFIAAPVAFIFVRMVMSHSAQVAAFKAMLAETEWKKKGALEEWNRQAGPQMFDLKSAELDRAIQLLKGIPDIRLRKLDQLKTDKRRLQLHAFLDTFDLESAKIPGIGAGRKTQLASNGVETAADINPSSIRISGFGPSTQGKLLDWRADLERRFVFDPARSIDPRDIMRVEQEVLMERKKAESSVLTAFATLQQEHARISAVRRNMRPHVEAALAAHAQAAADVAALQ